jgi:hypothetical protein
MNVFIIVSKSFFSMPLCEQGAPARESERTKLDLVMSEFAHVCIYLVISTLVYLIPLGVPFASNSSTYPEKLSANKCGFAGEK